MLKSPIPTVGSLIAISLFVAPTILHSAEDSSPDKIAANPVDTDGDGKPDAWDTDGDGKADAWDTNGDGTPDAWDTDGDGTPDKFDRDGDGAPDPDGTE